MRLRGQPKEDIPVDMSPMIDLVFLLLIFFLVASQIVKVEKVPVDVPEAVYAKVPEDETGRFTVTVNQDGEIFIGPESARVTVDDLRDRLTEEVEANPTLKVVLRADETVKYKTMEKIMKEACAPAGAMDMIFAAFEK
jgi:biopolymer transport protein ExbD